MARRGQTADHVDHALERMVFFSDAVFAIAITLLVIEIHVPELPGGASSAQAWDALWHLWPSLFGFALSFVVIARFWAGHHRIFAMTRSYDESFVWPNLFLLMSIAFMPFATAFMARNLGQVVPTLLYNLTLLTTALLTRWLAHRVLHARFLKSEVDPLEARMTRRRSWGVAAAAALAALLALFIPAWSQVALITIPLWMRLFAPRSQPGG